MGYQSPVRDMFGFVEGRILRRVRLLDMERENKKLLKFFANKYSKQLGIKVIQKCGVKDK